MSATDHLRWTRLGEFEVLREAQETGGADLLYTVAVRYHGETRDHVRGDGAGSSFAEALGRALLVLHDAYTAATDAV